MVYDVGTRDWSEQSIMSIRARHPQMELPGYIGRSFGELFARLQLLGVEPAGAPFVIYHEFGPTIDAEVCLPVGHELPVTGAIRSRTLPAMTVAMTLHVGPYEELGSAYQAVTDWIGDHGFEAAGPVHERYLNGPGEGATPSEYRTEVEIPIVPTAVAVPV